MTTKTLDGVMRRILNDPDVFAPPYDKQAKSLLPQLFETNDWKLLKEAFEINDKISFESQIDNQVKKLQAEATTSSNWRRNQIRRIIDLGQSLKKAYDEKPYILKQMFDTLNSFGHIECKLPNMEDYGKVIENHNLSIVEQYFLSKIDRERRYRRRALRKTLEYVKELYSMNLDILEIAFFIRKLDSLTQFMEVIKDE